MTNLTCAHLPCCMLAFLPCELLPHFMAIMAGTDRRGGIRAVHWGGSGLLHSGTWLSLYLS